MSDDEIITDAIEKHPECSHGEVYNGMSCIFQCTRVVKLWRNTECYLAGDPPRHVVEGYPGY